MTFTCPYCSVIRPTIQGLRSHIEQSSVFRERRYNAYAAQPDNDSDDSDSDEGDDDVEMPVEVEKMEESEESPSDDEEDQELSADPPYMEDSPARSPLPTEQPEPEPATRKHPRATVEEVEDEDERFVDDFPDDMEAGAPLDQCKTFFENLREEQKAAGNAPWYPFESEEEWELAQWLMTSGLRQKKTDAYLKLKAVRTFGAIVFLCR